MDGPVILTPSQTCGPFYGVGLMWEGSENAAEAGAPDAVEIIGTVVDGAGPFEFPAGMLEMWTDTQAVRTRTDLEGGYRVRVRRPGSAPPFADGRPQAPHLNVAIFGRGLLRPLLTRLYLPETDVTDDPVLELVPPDRREHLIARRVADGAYRFDICLQGEAESVFFTA